jgi:hypothetical protein
VHGIKLTVKQHAAILQKRCAITLAAEGKETPSSRLSKRGVIRVSSLRKFGSAGDEDEYAFDISEQDVFEFRGRERREVLWLCTIWVDGNHTVRVYQDKQSLEPVPPGVIDCAMTEISPSEYILGD